MLESYRQTDNITFSRLAVIQVGLAIIVFISLYCRAGCLVKCCFLIHNMSEISEFFVPLCPSQCLSLSIPVITQDYTLAKYMHALYLHAHYQSPSFSAYYCIQSLLSHGIITHAKYMNFIYMKSVIPHCNIDHEESVIAEVGLDQHLLFENIETCLNIHVEL